FGRSRDVLGQVLKLDNDPAVIIGVMPKDYRFPTDTDVWKPLIPTADLQKRENRDLGVFAFLPPNITQKSATDEMEAIGRSIEAEHPESNKGVVPVVHNFNQEFNGDDTYVILG